MKDYFDEVPKHKKKSKKRGLPRSKHKHENIMVCLEAIDKDACVMENGCLIRKPAIERRVARVCKICGRIDDVYFGLFRQDFMPQGMSYEEYMNTLPVWCSDRVFDKIAKPK